LSPLPPAPTTGACLHFEKGVVVKLRESSFCKSSSSEFNHEPHEQHEWKTKKDMNNGDKQGRNQVNYAQFVRVVRAVRG
jgi:hypothetical protein